jgi:glycosyltransferase involved in cell wall biosynthesis
MACGLPCAASDIPPNREVLADGEAGLLFPLGGQEGVYEALHRLAHEPDLAPRLAAAGRRVVDTRYAIDVVARRYQALYEEMVGSGVPTAALV